jgi:hypothetical protein
VVIAVHHEHTPVVSCTQGVCIQARRGGAWRRDPRPTRTRGRALSSRAPRVPPWSPRGRVGVTAEKARGNCGHAVGAGRTTPPEPPGSLYGIHTVPGYTLPLSLLYPGCRLYQRTHSPLCTHGTRCPCCPTRTPSPRASCVFCTACATCTCSCTCGSTCTRVSCSLVRTGSSGVVYRARGGGMGVQYGSVVGASTECAQDTCTCVGVCRAVCSASAVPQADQTRGVCDYGPSWSGGAVYSTSSPQFPHRCVRSPSISG